MITFIFVDFYKFKLSKWIRRRFHGRTRNTKVNVLIGKFRNKTLLKLLFLEGKIKSSTWSWNNNTNSFTCDRSIGASTWASRRVRWCDLWWPPSWFECSSPMVAWSTSSCRLVNSVSCDLTWLLLLKKSKMFSTETSWKFTIKIFFYLIVFFFKLFILNYIFLVS